MKRLLIFTLLTTTVITACDASKRVHNAALPATNNVVKQAQTDNNVVSKTPCKLESWMDWKIKEFGELHFWLFMTKKAYPKCLAVAALKKNPSLDEQLQTTHAKYQKCMEDNRAAFADFTSKLKKLESRINEKYPELKGKYDQLRALNTLIQPYFNTPAD